MKNGPDPRSTKGHTAYPSARNWGRHLLQNGTSESKGIDQQPSPLNHRPNSSPLLDL